MSSQPLPDEWYYLDGTKPVGPFTRDVMRQLRNAGKITADTSVACAGEDGWKPLAQHNLDPLPVPVPVPPPRSTVSSQTHSTAPPASVTGWIQGYSAMTSSQASSTAHTTTGIPKFNWIPAMVFQCIGSFIGILAELGDDNEVFLPWLCLAVIGMVATWGLLHWACWKALPEHLRFTTPQRAVGYMFIPFYNFYWGFISFPKLADGVVRWQVARGLRASDQLRGLALAMAVANVCMFTISLIPGVGILFDIGFVVIFAMFYKSLTEALNQLQES